MLRRSLIAAIAVCVMAVGASSAGGAQGGTVLSIAPVEGTDFSGLVARFQDIDHLGAAPPTATIDWGDGRVDAGTVNAGPSPGDYLVSGGHTYAHAGQVTVTVDLAWENDGVIHTVATAQVQVGDAPLTASPITFRANLGSPFTGAVGFFQDGNPNGSVDDIGLVVIDWGDGTESQGTVVARRGRFEVDGTHTYSRAGRLPVNVIVNSKAGASTTIHSTGLIPGHPHAVFSMTPIRRCADQPVTFDATSTTDSPGTSIVNHSWRFKGEFGAFPPPPNHNGGPLAVYKRAFGYSSIEMWLGQEDEDGEVVFPDPPVKQYHRPPIDVTLVVTDSTGETDSLTRRLVFADDGFRPTKAHPEPNCRSIFLSHTTFAVGSKLVTVDRSGGFGMRLACGKIADCIVVATVRRPRPRHQTHRFARRGAARGLVIGGGTGLIAAGRKHRVRVRLGHFGQRLLHKHGRLRTKVSVETLNSQGRSRAVTKTIVLRTR